MIFSKMRNLPSIYIVASMIPSHLQRKWKSRATDVKTFKAILDRMLKVSQDCKCAYCGLMMGKNSRRKIERDHFVPDSLFPEFRFCPNNLVAACSVCNGLEVKRATNTISAKGNTYEDSSFTIIHPRLDDINDHMEFAGQSGEIPFARIGSAKAVAHIELFDLQNKTQISLRRQERDLHILEEQVLIELQEEIHRRGI